MLIKDDEVLRKVNDLNEAYSNPVAYNKGGERRIFVRGDEVKDKFSNKT